MLTVEHAVGDGAARRDGLVVMVGVGLALLTGRLRRRGRLRNDATCWCL